MGAERLQDIIEIYRFKEGFGTYSSSCVLVYTGDEVVAKGLSALIKPSDCRELAEYLLAKGVSTFSFVRENGGRKRTRYKHLSEGR